MPEYAVQVVMAGHCSTSSIAEIDARLDKAGRAAFETPNGDHVSVSAVPYSSYVISVWWASKGNGS
jgi:hypothetical protein